MATLLLLAHIAFVVRVVSVAVWFRLPCGVDSRVLFAVEDVTREAGGDEVEV